MTSRPYWCKTCSDWVDHPTEHHPERCSSCGVVDQTGKSEGRAEGLASAVTTAPLAATTHECVFIEEQEPDGRLVLPPCIICGCTAMSALEQLAEVK